MDLDLDLDLDEWELLPDDGFLNGKKKKKNSPNEFEEAPVPDDGFVNGKAKEKSIPKAKELMEIPKPDVDFIREIREAPKETTSHEEVISDALFYNKKVQDQKFADMEIAPEKDDDDYNESEAAEDEGDRKDVDPIKKDRCCWDGFGLNIWKWKLTGIGALCSIGVAAAATTTICMFILGSTQRQKQHHMNQKLPLKIYPDDKV